MANRMFLSTDGSLSLDLIYEMITTKTSEISQKISEMGVLSSVLLFLLFLFLSLRVAQRVYYMLRGHVHHISFNPRKEMDLFIKKNNILYEERSFVCRDKVCLRYRKLGNGSKKVLLNNGVGTDFYMWLPTIKAMMAGNPNLFEDITLIAPSYRGLFGSDIASIEKEKSTVKVKELCPQDQSFFTTSDSTPDVTITMENCVGDAREIMKKEEIEQYHTVIGWSLGAQAALSCCAAYPFTTQNLFLLNPSTGSTIHYVLQTVSPFPSIIRKSLSNGIKAAILFLLPVIDTATWDYLKILVFSFIFRGVLEVLAFFGGFPPEQPVYFHGYMKDVFHTRNQTKGLLRLILSLDSPLEPSALTLSNNTVIISGLPDVLTGVFHSWRLNKSMPNSKHVMFTMASHFLLIEWPDLLAVEIQKILDVPCKVALKQSEKKPILRRK